MLSILTCYKPSCLADYSASFKPKHDPDGPIMANIPAQTMENSVFCPGANHSLGAIVALGYNMSENGDQISPLILSHKHHTLMSDQKI